MENKYAESFTDYLKGNVPKYMIFISRRQYAIIKADADHGDMAKALISKMRPSEKMDAIGNPLDENNSHYNDTIGLLGYRKPCYMQIQFPEKDKITQDQYDCLKEVLLEVDKHRLEHPDEGVKLFSFGNENFEIEGKDYTNDTNELLENIKQYIVVPDTYPDEVIIGKAITKEATIEDKANAIVEAMANNPSSTVSEDSSYKSMGFSSSSLLLFFSGLCTIAILAVAMVLTLN